MATKLYEIYDVYENIVFKIEFDTYLVHLARQGNRNAQRKIALTCRNSMPQGKRRGAFIHFQNLEFTNLESGKKLEQKPQASNSFAHRTDGLSACDNPRCVDCDNGHYEKCRYR